ncbi:MAG: tyrosine-type recombinase/integrase [Solobacterium sp.]|nr:tyrosine-type recombinase/integrase [Solobacterium sp.]
MAKWTKVNRKISGIKRIEVNELSGEYRVKLNYRYTDPFGNKKQTDTSWVVGLTLEKAIEKGFLVREREKKEKQKISSIVKTENQEKKKKKTIDDCLIEYRDELFELANNPKKKKTTYKSLYDDIGSIKKYHCPAGLLDTPIADIESVMFSQWIKHINSDTATHKGLAGRTVKRYKSALSALNKWLYESGYYPDETLVDQIAIRLKRFKTKALTEGQKEDRYCITYEDLEKIKAYYRREGLGSFYNYYYYTLWQVMFFTGLRVEEIVALQFKNIDFEANHGNGEISVLNAITQREDRFTALERTLRGEYRTKNAESRRYITMFGAYRQLLQDYKEDAYIYEFSEVEDIEEAFVFPNIQAKDPDQRTWFAAHKNILRELQKVCGKCNIPKTDSQMFRHACVTFLLKDMNYTEEDIFNYFGHTDTEMIHKIYSELTLRDKMKKANVKMNKLISTEDLGKIYEQEEKKSLKKITAGEAQARAIGTAKFYRIQDQILQAVARGQKVYYYNPKDEDIIQEIKSNLPSASSIDFRVKVKEAR